MIQRAGCEKRNSEGTRAQSRFCFLQGKILHIQKQKITKGNINRLGCVTKIISNIKRQ